MSKFWKSGSSSSSPSSDDDSVALSSDSGSVSSSAMNKIDDIETGLSDFKELTSELNEIDTKKQDFLLSDDEMSMNPDLAWKRIEHEQIFSSFHRVKGKKYDPTTHTRIVCMSDTHGCHRQVTVPHGDVLIHAGDFTNLGEVAQIADLSAYFGELSHENVICIAGNHEVSFQPDNHDKYLKKTFNRNEKQKKAARDALQNCTYLEDSACTVQEIKFYGSPWQPWFWDWAFNLSRGKECREVWKKIPTCTEVLITHGPPLGRGDLTSGKNRAGCLDLLREVQNRIKPRVHIFGHVHEGYGVSFDGTTLFVNAAIVTRFLFPDDPCIVIDLPINQSLPPIVVEPKCNLSSEELLEWLKQNAHGDKNVEQLILHFESAEPLIDGALLMDSSLNDVCHHLGVYKRDTRNLLRRLVSDLRLQSFE